MAQSNEARELGLVQAFVELAGGMVDDYDVVDFLDRLVKRCVELLGVSEAGLMLAAPSGRLQVMAASNERSHLLELFQLQNDEGPCLDCYRSGRPVGVDDLEAARARWPEFVPAARDAGFNSVQALPMRLRDDVLGALNLFHAEVGGLADADVAVGQALADVATIALLQERNIHDAKVSVGQLQGALDSRVVIEQAKGVVAEQATMDMDEAFARLRGYARSHNLRLSDVARDVIDGTISAQMIQAAPQPRDASP